MTLSPHTGVSTNAEKGHTSENGDTMTKDERIEELSTALRLCLPIIEAHTEASHLMDGFRPRRNKNDDILDAVKKAIGDIP